MTNKQQAEELANLFKTMTVEELTAEAKTRGMTLPQLLQGVEDEITSYGAEPDKWVGDKAPDVDENAESPFGALDRMAVKNLSNNMHDAAQYLREKNPGVEVTYHNGEFYGKRPESTTWAPMDPSGFNSVGEFASDAGDIIGDVASGAAQGVGGAAGAMGGLTLGPAGAIPGAMVGAGAAEGVVDSLKQLAGMRAGVNKSFNAGQTARNSILASTLAPVGGTAISSMGAAPMIARNLPNGMLPRIEMNLAEMLAKSQRVPVQDVLAKGSKYIMDEAGKTLTVGGLAPKAMNLLGKGYQGLTSTVSRAASPTVEYVARNGKAALAPYRDAVVEMAKPLTRQVNRVVEGVKGAAKTALNEVDKNSSFDAGPVLEGFEKIRQRVYANAQKIWEGMEPGVVTEEYKQQQKVLDKMMKMEEVLKSKVKDGRIDSDGYRQFQKYLDDHIDYKQSALLAPNPQQKAYLLDIADAASKTKQVLEREADIGMAGLADAKAGYKTAQQKATLVDQLLPDLNPRDQRATMSAVQNPDSRGIVNEIMRDVPEEYPQFAADRDKLLANLDYYGIDGSAFTPTGTMSALGAKGAVAAKSVPANMAFDMMTPVLGAGMAAGKGIRSALPFTAPVVSNGLGWKEKPREATNSPEEQARLQQNIIDMIKNLGAQK